MERKKIINKSAPLLKVHNLQGGGGGWGGTLIFSFIRRLGSFFGDQSLNFNILGAFRKMDIFGV